MVDIITIWFVVDMVEFYGLWMFKARYKRLVFMGVISWLINQRSLITGGAHPADVNMILGLTIGILGDPTCDWHKGDVDIFCQRKSSPY
jgi:hypothetical protein